MTDRRELLFPPYRLDLRERRLTRDGEEIRLQPKTFELLALLASRPGELVPREEVIASIWPDVVVSDDSLFRLVREARRALGDAANDPRYIETVPRAGLRFVAPVSGGKSAGALGRPAILAAGALALLAVLAVVLTLTDRADLPSSAGEPAAGPPGELLDVSALSAEREYQLGQRALARRGGDQVVAAYEHFEAALAAKPDHAGAMAALSLAMTFTPWVETADGQRRIRALSERALEIDPGLAMAHLARGKVDMRFPRRHEAAQGAMERVIELDPDNAEGYLALASLAASEGRLEDAMKLQRAGLAVAPDHRALIANHAVVIAKLGRFEEAEELLDAAEGSVGPFLTARPIIYAHTGRRIEKTRLLLQWFERSPLAWYLPMLAGELLALGEVGQARRLLAAEVNCETDRQQLQREGTLRLAVGGGVREALLERWLPRRDQIGSLDPLSNHLWHGRLAVAAGALDEAVEAYRRAFPSPSPLVGWQGSIEAPADQVQWLAHALVAQGRPEEARPFLDTVEAALADRIEAGLYPELHFVVLLRARNAALAGDADAALRRLETLVDRGWVDLAALDDPRWARLQADPRFAAIRRRVEHRARELLAELRAGGLDSRLDAAIAAHPRAMVESYRRIPRELIDPFPIDSARECVERIRAGEGAEPAAPLAGGP